MSEVASAGRKNTHGLVRIDRLYLVEQVTEELRKKILDGAFEPENILPAEGDLAGMFEVSRTVIREAMRNLRAQGLVEVSQGRRPRVKSPDPQAAIDTLDALFQRGRGTVKDLNEVRFAVEGEIASIAAERAAPFDISRLERSLDELRGAKTIEKAIEADMAFHRYLAEATRNPVFVLLIETLGGLLKESQRKSYVESGLEKAAEQHVPILEAVKRHDGNAAREAMMEHMLMG